MDVCTGEVTIKGAGPRTGASYLLTRSPRPRVSVGGARSPSSTIIGHRHISLYSAGSPGGQQPSLSETDTAQRP